MGDLFGAVCPCCGQSMTNVQRQPFDAFWEVWPDRRAKRPAQIAWSKLAPAEQQVAIDRARDWCAAWRKANPDASHIMASTYLNQRRFADEVASGTSHTPPNADAIRKMCNSTSDAVRRAGLDAARKYGVQI